MDKLKTSFETIAARAKKDHLFVELLLTSSESLTLGYQKQLLETYKASENTTAGFRLVKDGQQAYSYTENLSNEGLDKAYNEACSNLELLSQAGAPPRAIPIPVRAQNLDKKMPVESVDIEKLKAMAKDLEAVSLAADSRISVVPYCGVSDSKSKVRILNSNGLDVNFEEQHFSAYSYPLAKDGEISKMSGYGVALRDFAELNTAEISREATTRTLQLLSAKPLATGKYPVVLDKEVASDLFGLMRRFFSAKAVDENKSILKGRLDARIAAERITLTDDPSYVPGSAFRPFDAEGEVSTKTTLIEKGILKSFLTNLEYAGKMNLPHTASASRSPSSEMDISCSNLIFAKGDNSLEQLLGIYPKVVYLTELSGFHSGFNAATGDFSLPGQGFLCVDGQINHAVDQFVVSGNLLTLMQAIEEMGNEYNPPGNSVMTPDILLSELFFAGA